jgi:hypothetical protein
MTKLEILTLLREVFRESARAVYADDDPSGYRTKYLVDHEELMAELERRIEKENAK